MSDPNTTTAGKTPIPTLDTDNSNLKPGTSGDSPPPTSPASLAPPESSTGSVLSRPVSPSEKARNDFKATPSTLEQPETPIPDSYYGAPCPRAGLAVSAVKEDINAGIPCGTTLYIHDDPDRLPDFPYERPRRGLGRKLSPSPSPLPTSTSTPIPKWDPNSLPPVAAVVTAGPTLLFDEKPCLLITSPMPEDRWRATSSAIVAKFDNGPKGEKMTEKTGKYLNSLRNPSPTTKPRKNSIVEGVKSTMSTSLVATPGNIRPLIKVGRIWACSVACESLDVRKRDWALIELDPNVTGTADRKNEIIVSGTAKELKPARKGSAVKSGTRVVLGTGKSMTTPVTGTVGEIQPSVFGYQVVQKITLDKGCTVADGDAGACVADERSGRWYGVLVMSGMLSKEVEWTSRFRDEVDSSRSVAWFVPRETILQDIGDTFPVDKVVFPDIAEMIPKPKLANAEESAKSGDSAQSIKPGESSESGASTKPQDTTAPTESAER